VTDELRAVREVNRTLMRQSLIDQELLDCERACNEHLRLVIAQQEEQIDALNRQAGGYMEPTK